MILPQKQKVYIREVPQRRGGIKYFIDTLGNENGLFFDGIGGIYTKMPKTLIGGRFFIMGFPDFDEDAMELYKTICKHFRRNCKRVEGAYVAKDALSLLKLGWRLTINAEAPEIRYNDTMLPEQRDEENKRDYYGDDLVYRNDTLEMVLTDNGYVDAQGNYHYYILDYQGNVRQVVDAQGNVIEQNDYYPYGGLFGESASRQSYKYSGKELETMNGLNTYDFHARPYYYPTLQFHSPDLLSEKYYHVSPYLYCLGNPIMYIDNDGKKQHS